VTAAAVLGGLGGCVIAWALFSGTSSSQTNSFTAGSVGSGQKPSATVSGRDVALSWSAATNTLSYTVARANVAPQSLSTTEHGSCAGSVSGTSCTDVGVPENATSATNWTYTDTPFYDNWQGTASPPSSTVTVPAPSLSLAPATLTTAGGSTNATVSSFFDNEALTYCLDTQTVPCSSAQVGTGTVPATGGTTSDGLTIPSGLSTGSHTVYAVGSVGSIASATLTIAAGTGTRLVITSTAFTTTAATSATNAFTVTLEDAFNNPATSSTPVTVNLSASPATGAKFAATSGGGATSSVTLAANAQSVTAYFADTLAGSPTITASAGGLSSGTQTETVTAAGPSTLFFTQTVSGNQTVSATATVGPFTIQVQDQFGNPVTNTASAATITLSTTSGGTTGHTPFFTTTSGASTASTIAIATGASSTPSFYYSDTKAGSPTISASATINSTAVNGNTSGFTMVAQTTNDAMSIVQGNNQSATTSTAFPTALEVAVDDQFGNPVPNVNVTFTAPSSGASGTFATCSGGNPQTSSCVVATNSSGNATASTFTANSTAGPYNVTTSASGVSAPSTFAETNTSPSDTVTFSTVGSHTLTIPAGVTSLSFSLIGGGGGGPSFTPFAPKT
jgi:hypothetical protein